MDPELGLEPNGKLYWLFETHGMVAIQENVTLPPEIVLSNITIKITSKNLKIIQWVNCPNKSRPLSKKTVKELWFCLLKEVTQITIRGFLFQIDTMTSKPVCCKQQKYWPHKSKLITQFVQKLQDKNIIDYDNIPYGVLISLPVKASHKYAHWSQYLFRLCTSFRPLNTVKRQYIPPIASCDDTVGGIGKASFTINLNLYSV